MLNSVLETRKIEAGKMKLEDEEFDLGQLLQDVVDLYHPLGMRKGIDVVLDPCDGSIIKYSRVRGDRGKLKQILCNLLSNAIKFTSEGHVNVRAWVKKPSLQETVVASKKKGGLKHLHGLISTNKEERKDVEAIDRLQENSNFMEFVFEVGDTGKGIPKEQQESQVKETALGQGGTGLGLGIVQSLVRLMGGDIKIVYKKIEEKGTCFRFNVIFTNCETVFSGQTREEEQIDQKGDGQQSKLTITIPFNKQIISSPRPRLGVQSSSLKFEPSPVIVMIQDDKREGVTKKLLTGLGIEVLAVEQWDQPPLALHTVMENQKGKRRRSESNLAHDSLGLSQTSSNGDKDNTPSVQDRTVNLLSVFKRTSLRNSSGLVLLAIDQNAEPFQEIWRIISNFKRDLQIGYCRVFWLKKGLSGCINHMDCDLNQNDVITITKPFYSGLLYGLINLLSEFGGTPEDIESDKSTSSSKEESKSNSENSRMNSFSSSHSGNYTHQKHKD